MGRGKGKGNVGKWQGGNGLVAGAQGGWQSLHSPEAGQVASSKSVVGDLMSAVSLIAAFPEFPRAPLFRV